MKKPKPPSPDITRRLAEDAYDRGKVRGQVEALKVMLEAALRIARKKP